MAGKNGKRTFCLQKRMKDCRREFQVAVLLCVCVFLEVSSVENTLSQSHKNVPSLKNKIQENFTKNWKQSLFFFFLIPEFIFSFFFLQYFFFFILNLKKTLLQNTDWFFYLSLSFFSHHNNMAYNHIKLDSRLSPSSLVCMISLTTAIIIAMPQETDTEKLSRSFWAEKKKKCCKRSLPPHCSVEKTSQRMYQAWRKTTNFHLNFYFL